MSARIRRVIHPVIGVASWRDIQAARPSKCCMWCHQPIRLASLRTCCGKQTCRTLIEQACYWSVTKSAVIKRNGFVCRLCRNSGWGMEIDHIVPVSLGGTDDLENLRVLCRTCHAEETLRLRALGPAFVARAAS